jgi:peptidyl-dipeptidase Dcp
LFARVKAVWEERTSLGLNAVQFRLVEETHKDFVRGGANLSAADQERLRAINKELSPLTVRFGNNLLKETNAYRLVIENQADLAGLPNASPRRRRLARRRPAGQVGATLQAASGRSCPLREPRTKRQISAPPLRPRGRYDNKFSRGSPLREGPALGYPTHADFVLAAHGRVLSGSDLLNQLWTPASAVAEGSRGVQAMIASDGRSSSWRRGLASLCRR